MIRLLLILIMLGSGFSAAFIPQPAEAQIMNIDMNKLGGACSGKVSQMSGKKLFAHRDGSPALCSPYLLDDKGAPILDANKRKRSAGLFSRFFCVMETTLGLVISSTFCAIRDAWMAPFTAMMLLFMTITGIGFILGIVRLTVKEVSIVIFKMAIISLFILNADFAMEIAFGLYIGVMQETVRMMMDGFNAMAVKMPDISTNFISAGDMAKNVQDSVGTGNPFAKIDNQWDSMQTYMYSPTNNLTFCSIFTFLLMIVWLLPFASMIIFFALLTFLAFFARAAYGYMFALVMVTFLIAAMPIFVSCALFKVTTDLFEHWLKYLGSMVIQIFIVFAIMAFASLLDFDAFLSAVNSMIVPYDFAPVSQLSSFISFPLCSICDAPNFTTKGALPFPLLDIKKPCTSQNAMEYKDLIGHTEFINFLFMNGAALYIITRVMEKFVEAGPDMAKMLGGAKLVHTIGGLSSSGSGTALDNAVSRGTSSFEKGAKEEWTNQKEEGNMITRSWNSLVGGKESALKGTYVAKGEEYEKQFTEYMSLNRNAKKHWEDTNEKYDKAVENLKYQRIQASQGNGQRGALNSALQDFQEVDTERYSIAEKYRLEAAASQPKREDDTDKDWRNKNKKDDTAWSETVYNFFNG